jgi:multicomponent Na+:H+ antiporter subunit D
MLNHALFKSTLFLGAGVIAHAYGTRNIYEIKGVMRKMPVVGVATLLAVFGITGTPIFNGSVSKYFIVSGLDGFLSNILIFMSLGTIISFVKYSTILFGKAEGEPKSIDIWQHIPLLVLGSLCFIGGIFGQQAIRFLFDADVYIDPAGYLEKVGIFFASLVAGILIFKYFVKNSKMLKQVGSIDIGFRGIMIAMGLFFGTLLAYVGFLYA